MSTSSFPEREATQAPTSLATWHPIRPKRKTLLEQAFSFHFFSDEVKVICTLSLLDEALWGRNKGMSLASPGKLLFV